ncbi:hypothetical protein ADIARSV_2284 [Arcticibacter svalbardensis MN12-7]|uniref:Uncharacterized protein n=1 Tax=Arcticibacter svalbardensis MN12-7 TaxID=1150600 RepID=R9GSL0_9SPHI|nr:SIR2 family protein [Arcticibacter svalbardensis]EOR94545.1 hypothetical protein ADIARSV_2284 [Arcticibacter svalbardensis MN12-7]
MKPSKQNYHKQLKDLRNKLAANQMSLLVGSGLSKNVSSKFPTWDELLFDLACELNERTISSAYDQYLKTAPATPLKEGDFKKEECLHLIRQQGYLEIVSEYIKRKTIPESITTYIEERIPSVYRKGDNFFLDCNGTVELLQKENLILHKNLIGLPWNNIYTTNYDDLLDVCIDNSRYERLVSEIDQLESEIPELEQDIRDSEEKKESLSKPLVKPEIEDIGMTPLEGLEPLMHENPNLNLEINKLSIDIKQQKSRLQQKELLLSEKNREVDDCYQVVKTSADLRIKKRKNIIKLHGSLRSARERLEFFFEFDGDHKKQYVISKEDYENYPTNHEAFTQLMRISLLQESFCLIGFSGIDPNFLQWINWVRDILYKAARINNKNNRYKIYLLDIGKGEVSRDKQLFYENHNIIRIPLLDPDVLQVFREDLGAEPNIYDGASAIGTLITYLGNDDNIKQDIPSPDISIRREHRQIWDALCILETKNIPDEHTILPMLNRLEIIAKQIWLPDLSFSATHNQHSLLGFVFAENSNYNLLERPLLRKLTISALLDLAVPIRSFLKAEVIAQLLSQPDNQSAIAMAVSRNDALSGVIERTPVLQQDELLHLAYSFQFLALQDFLDNWSATGRQEIVRAGFLAIFDPQAAGDYISEAVENETLTSGEEKLYALEMLHHIKQPFLLNNNKRISRLISAYERSGNRGLQNRIEELQKKVAKKAQQLKPYNDKLLNQTRSVRLSKHSDAQAAVQLLMLLAESGFQLSIRNIYLLSSEDWYPVLKAGFEYYPLPFLFYSLQYNKKDFLKKAGQDYAFSSAENVSEQLPRICSALFANLPEAPDSYADNIQVFLSSLVIGVDPAIWQLHFCIWWRTLLQRGIAFRKNNLDTHPLLVNAAIQYVSDTTILYEIVANCLDSVLIGEIDQSINFLYYLNRNQYFKAMPLDVGLANVLSKQFDELISGLDTINIARIFVLGNLYRLLTPDQSAKIVSQLLDVDYEKITNARIWRVLLHFANGQAMLGKLMRQALVNHRNLWYTGINGNQISSGQNDEPILISDLSYGDLRPIGLQWNNTELTHIFDRLQNSLADLERMAPAPDFWFSFIPVLEEMFEFLTGFDARIGHYPEYEATLSRVQQQLGIHRKYKELEEGLTSRDETAVENALRELDDRVYKNVFERDNITLLLNKILLQAEPAVETSLGYMTTWLFYKRNLNRFRDQESLLLRILRKYDAQPLEDADVAYVEEKLIRIAWLLKTWDSHDPIVLSWLEKAEESRYNNVRQFIASVSEGSEDQDEE